MAQPGNSSKNREVLDILYGGSLPEKIPDVMMLVAECVERPASLYRHIEAIIKDPLIKEHRLHLVRVQLVSELRMREDVDLHTQRIWVAQAIEKLAFGGLKLEGEKPKGADEDEEDE